MRLDFRQGERPPPEVYKDHTKWSMPSWFCPVLLHSSGQINNCGVGWYLIDQSDYTI